MWDESATALLPSKREAGSFIYKSWKKIIGLSILTCYVVFHVYDDVHSTFSEVHQEYKIRKEAAVGMNPWDETVPSTKLMGDKDDEEEEVVGGTAYSSSTTFDEPRVWLVNLEDTGILSMNEDGGAILQYVPTDNHGWGSFKTPMTKLRVVRTEFNSYLEYSSARTVAIQMHENCDDMNTAGALHATSLEYGVGNFHVQNPYRWWTLEYHTNYAEPKADLYRQGFGHRFEIVKIISEKTKQCLARDGKGKVKMVDPPCPDSPDHKWVILQRIDQRHLQYAAAAGKKKGEMTGIFHRFTSAGDDNCPGGARDNLCWYFSTPECFGTIVCEKGSADWKQKSCTYNAKVEKNGQVTSAVCPVKKVWFPQLPFAPTDTVQKLGMDISKEMGEIKYDFCPVKCATDKGYAISVGGNVAAGAIGALGLLGMIGGAVAGGIAAVVAWPAFVIPCALWGVWCATQAIFPDNPVFNFEIANAYNKKCYYDEYFTGLFVPNVIPYVRAATAVPEAKGFFASVKGVFTSETSYLAVLMQLTKCSSELFKTEEKTHVCFAAMMRVEKEEDVPCVAKVVCKGDAKADEEGWTTCNIRYFYNKKVYIDGEEDPKTPNYCKDPDEGMKFIRLKGIVLGAAEYDPTNEKHRIGEFRPQIGSRLENTNIKRVGLQPENRGKVVSGYPATKAEFKRGPVPDPTSSGQPLGQQCFDHRPYGTYGFANGRAIDTMKQVRDNEQMMVDDDDLGKNIVKAITPNQAAGKAQTTPQRASGGRQTQQTARGRDKADTESKLSKHNDEEAKTPLDYERSNVQDF